MFVLLAALPIIVVVFLMLVLMWPSSKAMPVGYLTAVIIAFSGWRMPFRWIMAATVAGVINALDILIIVFGALLILQLMKKSGGIAQISSNMATISADRRIQVVIIAWFMGSFLEGAAGFGTPAAIGAPLLVGMGFPPFIAAIVTLLADSAAVIFGGVGVPLWGGFDGIEVLGRWPVETAAGLLSFREFLANVGVFAATVNLLVGSFIPLVIVCIMTKISEGSFKGGLKIWPVLLLAGFFFTLPQFLIAVFIGPELPSLLGSLTGLFAFILLIKSKYLIPRKAWDFANHKDWPSEWEGIIKAGEHIKLGEEKKIGTWRAWMPYILIGILLVSGRVELFGLTSVLRSVIIQWTDIFGTTIERGIMPFYNPGIFPFLIVALFIPLIHHLHWKSASRAWGEVLRMIQPATLALVFALGMVYIMINTGEPSGRDSMLIVIAKAAAQYTGAIWYMVSPLVGVLGAFVAGSATVSNIMFGTFQYSTAQNAGLPVIPVLALQSIGGAAGNVICIHNIVAVLTTVGLVGREGKIIKWNILVAVFYALFGGIAGWLLAVNLW